MAKCPICGKYKSKKQQILDHIEEVHSDDIPDGYTPAMCYYSLYHNGRITGQCRICKKPTPWRSEAGKPAQLCGSPICKKTMRDDAIKNMLRVHGKVHLLNDPEQQKKMLAHRKISGIYKWSDCKHDFTYTGTYEEHAIHFIDTVLNINPDSIQMPGPAIPYTFEGKDKFWITDIYLEDFNLIIEIKDGIENLNTHPGFAYNRKIEKVKDDLMKNQTEFNYIKLTNKNMLPLIEMLTKIRNENILSASDDFRGEHPLVVINESALGLSKKEEDLYIMLVFDPKINTFITAGLSFDLYLSDIFTKYGSLVLHSANNDIMFTNKIGYIFKYKGETLDTGKLKASLFGCETHIDESIVPDAFNLIKELLAEVHYDMGEIVTPLSFFMNDDFELVQKINNISQWDYLRYQEDLITESAKTMVDEKIGILTESSDIIKKQMVYYGLTDKECDLDYVSYQKDDRFTGKAVNLSLDGLQRFIKDNDMYKIITRYIEIPLSTFKLLDNVDYDKKYDMICVETPFKFHFDHEHIHFIDKDMKTLHENAAIMDNFVKKDMTKETINNYKSKCSDLKHVKYGNGFSGIMLIDTDDEVVGYIQCNTVTKYVVALYVSEKYRHNGIADKLLDLVKSKYGVKYLSVNKKNQSAINLYIKKGYSIIKTDDTMEYMQMGTIQETISVPNNPKHKLYHLTFTDDDGKTLHPNIPHNYLTKNNYEENKTPRVCFSTSIDGALTGISQNLANSTLFINEPEDYGIISVKEITNKEVPDASLTDEIWVTTPVKLKCVGKIKVSHTTGEGLTYKYGNLSAETYRWKWSWIGPTVSE